MIDNDPFQKFTTIALGGDPNSPPPPQVEARPTSLTMEGIRVSSDRLTALDQVVRKAAAIRAGHADALADLRARRDDLRQRTAHLRSRVAHDTRMHTATANLAELDAEIAAISSQMSEVEAELTSSAAAVASARANLKAAMAFARDCGLAIPVGIEGGRA